MEWVWKIGGGLVGLFLLIDGLLGKFSTAKAIWAWLKRARSAVLEVLRMPRKLREMETKAQKRDEEIGKRLQALEEAQKKRQRQQAKPYAGVRWARQPVTGRTTPYCDICYQDLGQFHEMDVVTHEKAPERTDLYCPSEHHQRGSFGPEQGKISLKTEAYQWALENITFD